jgi:SAM-dependent methyltransferase
VKCSGCGLLYVTPRPSPAESDRAAISGVHQGEAALVVTGCFAEWKIKHYRTVLEDLYGRHWANQGKTWLDVGCGHGEFLLALRQYSRGGIVGSGLEPNVGKQESARARGLNVSSFELDGHAERYDVVSFLNVYSHLHDPPTFMRECRAVLKPRGELLVQTGDSADIPSDEIFRPLSLPDHLSFASEKIVVNLLRRSGFREVAVKKYPVYPFKAWPCIKAFVKLLFPSRRSEARDLIRRYWLSHKYHTDMYIRAVLEE